MAGNGTETFVFRWTDATKEALLRYIGLFASSNLTSFSYDDAAFVSEAIRNTTHGGSKCLSLEQAPTTR